MSQLAFSTLKLHADLLKNLTSLGYETMTPIQAKSLPHILAGEDVIAQSKTGSGKTAAFGLGLLEKLDAKRFFVQSLVLCPTRELADQVATEIRKLARAVQNIKVVTICGGMPFGPQVGSLEHGAHIVVGTPGRIGDHLKRGTMRLNKVSALVLDEADRMLDMGFQAELDAIIEQIPAKRQTLLFSATFSAEIQAIAKRIMNKPAMAQVASAHDDSTIKQHFYKVEGSEHRLTALRLLLMQHQPESTVVFCNTKRETLDVTEQLTSFGFSALALNGDLEQRERDQALIRFANKSVSILVATDVAARGLDIDSLDAVVNYQLGHDTETHIHRIGRTGRAGSKGMAYSFFADKDGYKIALLEEQFDLTIKGESLPRASVLENPPFKPTMATLQIDGGKKQKLRPGDILGGLTGENGIQGKQVGKISVSANWAFVAVSRDVVKAALNKLGDGKLKGRSFRVRSIG